jgi:hypothetical protein
MRIVQGREADCTKLPQELNEEQRTAQELSEEQRTSDVVTSLMVTPNQKFMNIELTFSLAQFAAARTLLTTDRTAEMTTAG